MILGLAELYYVQAELREYSNIDARIKFNQRSAKRDKWRSIQTFTGFIKIATMYNLVHFGESSGPEFVSKTFSRLVRSFMLWFLNQSSSKKAF